MQLSILGPVLVEGRAPRGAKERALLARLLEAPGTPVPAEALIEAAWLPEARGDVTRSLHVRLAKLRALIGPDRIVREPAGYRLATAPESVDAHRIAALAVETAHRSPFDALALCDEALALWRSEPFADLVLADDAATVEARRLHTTRDRLRRARAAALTALGRSDEAATETGRARRRGPAARCGRFPATASVTRRRNSTLAPRPERERAWLGPRRSHFARGGSGRSSMLSQ